MRKWTLLFFLLAFLLGCAREDTMPAKSLSMDDVLAPDIKVEQVTGGFQFTEGPVWMPDGYLLFSDIPANIIYKWTPGAAKAEVWRAPSGNSNGLTLDAQGRLLACEHSNRRVSRTEQDGTITLLADRYDGKKLNSPNDIVVHSSGAIYFTDPPYGLPNQKVGKELDFNGVYRLAPDGAPSGTLTLLDDSLPRPNGLAFSPDERVLYVDDSQLGIIRAYDVQPDGTLANARLFAELKGDKEGVPDGMKVDLMGNVFCTGPGGVWVFNPAGDKLGVIEMPEVPANLAWGGPDFKTLYVTAQTGLYRVQVKTGGKLAGSN
ncbi:MAG: SMP-30/gluconolactonase/LRE family protein [Anaerolineae bacterium]|nr:SMP-30/gluconolactonase/LRE family protein [Anaerolineae bacterium]